MNYPKELTEYLSERKLMTLATFSKNPWICFVYYTIDDDLNLYFISDPKSEHGVDIEQNNEISCAIADSNQDVGDEKIGVQIYGTVSFVSGVEKLKWFFKMWGKLNPSTKDRLNFENLKQEKISSKVYKISPQTIKFFNEKLYSKPPFMEFSSN